MQVDIHTKNLELNAPLRAFVEEKSSDLEHVLGDAGHIRISWEVGLPSQHHRSGPVFYAEANLTVGGTLLRAESNNHDLHAAIVDVKDDLKIQIKKFKDRRIEAERQPADE